MFYFWLMVVMEKGFGRIFIPIIPMGQVEQNLPVLDILYGQHKL